MGVSYALTRDVVGGALSAGGGFTTTCVPGAGWGGGGGGCVCTVVDPGALWTVVVVPGCCWTVVCASAGRDRSAARAGIQVLAVTGASSRKRIWTPFTGQAGRARRPPSFVMGVRAARRLAGEQEARGGRPPQALHSRTSCRSRAPRSGRPET